MDPRGVLFVGGNVDRLSSIKIRCADIATRLGCDCHYRAATADDIPSGYQVYICVKPDFREPELSKLRKKGRVIWDILDDEPPLGDFTYIVSTKFAAKVFAHLGDLRVVPHHHCNIDRVVRPLGGRRVMWVGQRHWYPPLPTINHDCYFVDGLTRQEVVEVYTRGDIALNLRNPLPIAKRHIEINSGIKLLNCLAFGIPSISGEEPAYREFGPHCTIFSSLEDCPKWLDVLVNDEDRFKELRANCLETAEKFHIDQIVDQYRRLITSL